MLSPGKIDLCSLFLRLFSCGLSAGVLRAWVTLLPVGQQGTPVPLPPLPAIGEQPADRITLPIEVFGSDGAVGSIEFDLDDSSAIDALYLRAHRIGYPDGHSSRAGEAKASVSLNGGPWIPVTNATADVFEPARSYGGIGGGFATLRLRLPLDGWNQGLNRVSFRFEGTDGQTSGFRVIELNPVRGTEPVLPAASFRHVDPSTFDPVVADPLAGRVLWYRRDSLTEPGGGMIRASCSDCHSEDGRDLAVFHYSNRSIITRAMFHGLTLTEGEQVAAYIRDLDIPVPEAGRPWNPPYQPGAGLDAAPDPEWSAGAGLDAVLQEDADMLAELPPGAGVFDATATLNVREMRVAVQFPDWNAWLPTVHPLDIWGDHFENGDAQAEYATVRSELPPLAASGNPALIELLGRMDDGVRRFIGLGRQDTTGGGPWRTLEGTTVDLIPSAVGREWAKLALSRWMGVKTWELVQQNELEALPALLRPPHGGVERGEWRGWPSDGQSVWANAPHMTADDRRSFTGQSDLVGLYESSVWYQLQLTLNAGMRLEADTRPMDWSYHFIHLVRLANESGEPQALRFIQGKAKAYQARDNGLGPDVFGWQLRFLHPWQMYSDDRGDTSFFDALDGYQPGLRAAFLTDSIESFLDMVSTRPEFHLALWPRRDPDDYDNSTHAYWYALEEGDYVPEPWSGSGDLFDQPNYNHADAFYRLNPLLGAAGVPASTVQRLADWCRDAWPAGVW